MNIWDEPFDTTSTDKFGEWIDYLMDVVKPFHETEQVIRMTKAGIDVYLEARVEAIKALGTMHSMLAMIEGRIPIVQDDVLGVCPLWFLNKKQIEEAREKSLAEDRKDVK